MGESFGAWTLGRDAELMDYVSSVNVACGFHAGDASVIRQTIETAIAKNVAVGAHPSFPDLQGFGRREMKMSAAEIFDIFRGKNVPEGRKSVAYAFTYRGSDRTLTEAEVNGAHEKLVARLRSDLQAETR